MRLGLGLGLGIGRASGIASGSGGLILPNLLTKTELFENAAWIKTSMTVSANTTVAPDGNTTADTITSGAAANQGMYQVVAVDPSTAYCFSYHVQLGTMLAASYKFAFYNATGAAFISQDIVPAQTPVSGSWTRISQAVTTPAGCVSMRVYPFRNTASTSGTFFLWGAMLNTGSLPATYAAVA